jgi:hypothetical protein
MANAGTDKDLLSKTAKDEGEFRFGGAPGVLPEALRRQRELVLEKIRQDAAKNRTLLFFFFFRKLFSNPLLYLV